MTGARRYAFEEAMLMVTGMITGEAAGSRKPEARSGIRDVVQPRGAVVHQVLQPPGGGHQHIHAPLQRLGLHQGHIIMTPIMTTFP